MGTAHIGWTGIVRLGLVQTALGAVVVLTTSTMNRVMVVELALPAMLPGLLVGLHYAVQMLRPRLGHGSDVGGRRTPWIVGGMGVLATGGLLAAIATAWMASEPAAAILLALLAFALIGVGVGAAGTSLLVLLAKRVDASRRAPAATIVWIMMIAGFAVTAAVAGHFLDPYTPARLVAVTGTVSALAILITLLAVRNVERTRADAATPASGPAPTRAFREALVQVWGDRDARRFTVFVFVSMLAYSLQDLILEPFAGSVFGFTPGESTRLAGVQHAGVLCGMIVVALAGSGLARGRCGSLRAWMVGGCLLSALALSGLAVSASMVGDWPLRQNVFLLGLGNGAFAVAAIGSMMAMASAAGDGREGIRMGLWGAAQAIAFGVGGFLGTVAADVARLLLGSVATAYASVFAIEGALFLMSAVLALQVSKAVRTARRTRVGMGSAAYAARAEGG